MNGPTYALVAAADAETPPLEMVASPLLSVVPTCGTRLISAELLEGPLVTVKFQGIAQSTFPTP